MDEQLASAIKEIIDENMFTEIKKLAKEQGLTTSGWIRENLWKLIREQKK